MIEWGFRVIQNDVNWWRRSHLWHYNSGATTVRKRYLYGNHACALASFWKAHCCSLNQRNYTCRACFDFHSLSAQLRGRLYSTRIIHRHSLSSPQFCGGSPLDQSLSMCLLSRSAHDQSSMFDCRCQKLAFWYYTFACLPPRVDAPSSYCSWACLCTNKYFSAL